MIYTYTLRLKLIEHDAPPISHLLEPHQRQFTFLTSQPGTYPKPTQPWCEYHLVWDITSWWWDQMAAYIPTGPAHHPVLPYRAGTNLTPWSGEAVIYRDTTQHLPPLAWFGYWTWFTWITALHANHYTMGLTGCIQILHNISRYLCLHKGKQFFPDA